MINLSINGFGRIGRSVLRRILSCRSEIKIVAINDLTDPKILAHLLKYDSVYGVYKKQVKASNNSISVNGNKIKVFSEKDPENLPWKDLNIDVVLECTGVFRDLEGAEKHLKAGAKKVIISAPAKSPEIPSFLLGINEEKYDSKKDNIVDMGSCTTNCLAPIVKVLDDNFGIVKGFMTTIHSYTSDQNILDLPHKDLRRARAAALNIVPTTTGAAKAISRVIPKMNGKLDGIAIRVPTPTVSIVDLVCEVKKKATFQQINYAFKKASHTKRMNGILGIEDALLVSSDYIGNSYSSIVDAENTKVIGDKLVKVLSWYDNEYGYASRLADFAQFIGKKIKK